VQRAEQSADDIDARTFEAWLADTNALNAALRFASATGALCVTRNGAFESMPTRSEVERLLEQHRDHAPV
jgi:sugar/nucleoside kinase (ribokinase family)